MHHIQFDVISYYFELNVLIYFQSSILFFQLSEKKQLSVLLFFGC